MASKQKRNPFRVHFLIAGLLTAAATVLLWWLSSGQWHWLPLLLSWLAAVNVIAFTYYGYDKVCAKQARRRVPELVLHGLSLGGGSVGAFLAMNLFRHKTIKGPFRILFWCIVALQTALAAWVCKMAWRG